MITEKPIEDFEKALAKLDEKLEINNQSAIVIKVIGGFAMLYYGMEEHGYTIDIDSLTDEFDETVKGLIREVGKELGLDNDWLNTDCATLDGFLTELEPNIHWKKTDYKYNNIDLYIADIIGLLETKVKAVHDGGLVPRVTDKKDMILLLKMIDVHNKKELDKKETLKFIREKYERSYQYLIDIGEW